jgi:hypothetical protein
MPPTSQFWAMPTNCEWPLTGNLCSHRECLQLAESAQSASTRIDLAAVTAVHKDAIEFPAQYVDKINELLIKSRPQPPNPSAAHACASASFIRAMSSPSRPCRTDPKMRGFLGLHSSAKRRTSSRCSSKALDGFTGSTR